VCDTSLTLSRDLFPEACFVQKSGDELLSLKDYDDYLKTAQRLASKSDRVDGRACFETLVRGQTQLVNNLLDQIQNGAFYALQMKVLKSMVISICLDKDRPQDVLESYAYTFSYRTSSDGLTILDDIALTGKTDAITFYKAKLSLNSIVRHVNYECKNKPCLPDQRYITVRLIYNDDWDATLNIPGFHTDEHGIGVGEAIGWQRVVSDLNNPVLDAGFHG
jgi:meiosis-specific protein HOP1